MKVEAFYRKRKQLSEYLPASERHKLKVERTRGPAAAVAASVTSAAQNSPARTVIDKSNDNSLLDSPAALNATVVTSGKRRPSDPDSEADMSLSGDSSRMPIEVTNGEEAQPPMKKSNTTATSNGNSLEVS